MKIIALVLFTAVTIYADLLPTPLFTDPESMQQIGWKATQEHLDVRLFSQNYGISFLKLRIASPETFLGVISDQT